MSRCREVDAMIWNDADFCRLTDDGKMVFFLLLTHPAMTALGTLKSALPKLAAQLQWDEHRFARGFREAMTAIAAHAEKGLSHA